MTLLAPSVASPQNIPVSKPPSRDRHISATHSDKFLLLWFGVIFTGSSIKINTGTNYLSMERRGRKKGQDGNRLMWAVKENSLEGYSNREASKHTLKSPVQQWVTVTVTNLRQ